MLFWVNIKLKYYKRVPESYFMETASQERQIQENEEEDYYLLIWFVFI